VYSTLWPGIRFQWEPLVHTCLGPPRRDSGPSKTIYFGPPSLQGRTGEKSKHSGPWPSSGPAGPSNLYRLTPLSSMCVRACVRARVCITNQDSIKGEVFIGHLANYHFRKKLIQAIFLSLGTTQPTPVPASESSDDCLLRRPLIFQWFSKSATSLLPPGSQDMFSHPPFADRAIAWSLNNILR